MNRRKNSKEQGSNSVSNFRSIPMKMSWGNIEDLIASFIHATQKGRFKKNDEIVHVKINNYEGGYVSSDKELNIEVLVKKGVKVITFG